jgi:hypothetical protein
VVGVQIATKHSHILATSYITSQMPSASKARKLRAQQSRAFQAVEDSPKLLDLLEIATSPARQAIFIENLLETLPSAFAQFDKNPEELFTIFTAWFGVYPDSNLAFGKIHAAVKHRQMYFTSANPGPPTVVL